MFTLDDLAEYTGMDIGDISPARFDALSAEAEALIRAYNRDLPDEYQGWPKAAKAVALRVVARVFEHQEYSGMTGHSYTAGPFSVNRSYDPNATSGNLYLSKQDKMLLGGRGGSRAYSIDMMPAEAARDGLWRTPTWWEPNT